MSLFLVADGSGSRRKQTWRKSRLCCSRCYRTVGLFGHEIYLEYAFRERVSQLVNRGRRQLVTAMQVAGQCHVREARVCRSCSCIVGDRWRREKGKVDGVDEDVWPSTRSVVCSELISKYCTKGVALAVTAGRFPAQAVKSSVRRGFSFSFGRANDFER